MVAELINLPGRVLGGGAQVSLLNEYMCRILGDGAFRLGCWILVTSTVQVGGALEAKLLNEYMSRALRWEGLGGQAYTMG